MSKVDRVPNLLSILVPLHDAVKGGTLPCFSMGIIRTHCIDLDVEAICLKELFIYVGAILTDLRPLLSREKLAAVVIGLAEEDVVTGTTGSLRAVVDLNLMILSVDRLFHIRLIETLPVDNQIVFILLDANLFVLIE